MIEENVQSDLPPVASKDATQQTVDSGPPVDAPHPVAQTLSVFLAALSDHHLALQLSIPAAYGALTTKTKEARLAVNRFKPEATDEHGGKWYSFDNVHEWVAFQEATRELDKYRGTRATEILTRSLFIFPFCEFDNFTGSMLKAIYNKNPALLHGIHLDITMKDLLTYESLDAVRSEMLDKEIETFRRDSYVDQFAELEKKFGLELRKFPEWSRFVEIGQRRNLIVHNDGRINQQYITVCKREGVNFSKNPSIGERLEVDLKYILNASQLLGYVAFMLTFTLWRKALVEDTAAQIDNLNSIVYEQLRQRKWKTAARFASFGLSKEQARGASDLDLRMRRVNAVIGYKFSKQPDRCKELLDAVDWTATIRDFQLALLVLRDDFKGAGKLMMAIGKEGELVTEAAYHEWPLFHEFRNSEEFLFTYQNIFGKPFESRKIVNASNDTEPRGIANGQEEVTQVISAVGTLHTSEKLEGEVKTASSVTAVQKRLLPKATKKRVVLAADVRSRTPRARRSKGTVAESAEKE